MKKTFFVCVLSIMCIINNGDVVIFERLASYQRCQYDSDCKENSFCYGNNILMEGNCKCKDGYYMDKNRTYYECVAPSGIDQPCTKDLQCVVPLGPTSSCTEEKVCQCNEGAHLASDGYCYISRKLTEVCKVKEECLLSDGTNAYCTEGHCECPIKHHPGEDLQHCVPSLNLGEPCETDESCNHTFAACYTFCKCVPGYVTSRNEEKCLKAAAKFGDSCDEDAQCAAYLTGGICSGYTCDCSIGFHGYGVSCYRDAFVDEACTDRRECVLSQEMDNAVDCLEGICTCLTQRSIDGKGCLPIERTSSASRFMDVRIVLSAVAFASVCLLMDFV